LSFTYFAVDCIENLVLRYLFLVCVS